MIAADRPGRRSAKLLAVDAGGRMRRLPRAALASLFSPGDLVIANDAATLPASLRGRPQRERRADRGPPCGMGDRRATRRGLTQSRSAPAIIARGRKTGRRLRLFRRATVLRSALSTPSSSSVFDPPRLFRLRFLADRATVLAGLARSGRPIQYAHVAEPLALWDVWTSIAADPIAFEPPSAGFALEWRTLAIWRRRGVGFATLTHAAGLSSTGCPTLDSRLPFDEPFAFPSELQRRRSIARSRAAGGSSPLERPSSARSKRRRTATAACGPAMALRAEGSGARRSSASRTPS